MDKLVFATGNKNKLNEIKEILSGAGYDIISMKEAGVDTDIEENGTTFAENAIIKAKAVAEATGCITLADDSGLEIDFLDKQPGIYSARFLGHDTGYDIKNQYFIDKLEGVPTEKRTARYVCAIAAVWPDGRCEVVVRNFEGYIGYEQRGTNGFGFDPIFMVPEFNKSAAELTPEEKNLVSHRGKALRAMKEILASR